MNDAIEKVICYGETLWDVFPDIELPGGAPMNVAVHLNLYKVKTAIVSRVGEDPYGERLFSFLRNKNVSSRLVQKDKTVPTGMVKVHLSEGKNATYDIVFPAAWDFIEIDDNIIHSVKNSKIFVFGSLAARSEVSRKNLFKLIEVAQTKIFDVNLRTPHFSSQIVLDLIQRSSIVKLNEDELYNVGEWLGKKEATIEEACKLIEEHFQPELIVVTLGSKGAMTYKKGEADYHRSYDVIVKDTVGSGDAFLAAYIFKFLQNASTREALSFACAAGSLVASKQGANPEYNEEDVINVQKNFRLT
jgi:fructokinase